VGIEERERKGSISGPRWSHGKKGNKKIEEGKAKKEQEQGKKRPHGRAAGKKGKAR
jgi:hypothetical protein